MPRPNLSFEFDFFNHTLSSKLYLPDLMNELKRLFPIKMTKKSKFMVILKDKIELHLKVYDIIFLSEWYEKHMFEFIETKLFKTSDIITWKAISKDTIMYMYMNIHILCKIHG